MPVRHRRTLRISPSDVVESKTLTIDNSSNAQTLTNYVCSVTLTSSNVTWSRLDEYATNVKVLVGGAQMGHVVTDWQGQQRQCTIHFKVSSIPGSSTASATLQIMRSGITVAADTSIFLLYDRFGDAAFPGNHDWLQNTFLKAGEHAIVKDGFIYAEAFDPDGGTDTGRLVKINPDTGASVWDHTTQGITGHYGSCAPAKDNAGKFHCYSKKKATGDGCEVRRFDSDGNSEAAYDFNTTFQPDWEALPYDPVNNIILGPLTGGGLRAINATTYTSVWTNDHIDVTPTGGASNLPVPLLWGDYWIVIDADAKVWKINRLTGLDPSGVGSDFLQLSEGVKDDTYCCPVWDSQRERVYWANGGGIGGHRVYSINLGTGSATPTVDWVKVILDDDHEVRRPLALDTANGKLYVPTRLVDSPYSSKVICLDVDDDGEILWTNETAWDQDAAIAQVLCDADYVYAATTDYTLAGWNKLLVLDADDGTLQATHDLAAESASCGIFPIGGGRLCIGLWGINPPTTIKHEGFQCIRVRESGGYGDIEFKVNLYRTGYVGDYMSGALYSPSTTLDTTTKWDLFSSGATGGGSQAAGRFKQIGNNTEFRGLRSKSTFWRGTGAAPGFAMQIRVRNRPDAPASGNWPFMIVFAGTHPNVEPLRVGRFLNAYDCKIHHGGSDVVISMPATHGQRHDDVFELRTHGNHVNFLLNDVSKYTRDDWNTTHMTAGNERKLHVTGRHDVATAYVDLIIIREFSYPDPTVTVS